MQNQIKKCTLDIYNVHELIWVLIFAQIDLKKKTGVYWQQIYNGGIVWGSNLRQHACQISEEWCWSLLRLFIFVKPACKKTHTYKVQKVYRHLFDSVTTMLACLFVCWLGDALLPAKSVKRGSLWSQISWKYIDPKSQNLLQAEHNGTSDGFLFYPLFHFIKYF